MLRLGQPYLVVDWPAQLSGPAAPGFTASQGSVPGSVNLLIHTAPTNLGDGPDAGDGRGVITGYASSINGVVQTHPATLPIQRTATGLPLGAAINVQVWALGYAGRATPIEARGTDTVFTLGPISDPVGPSVPAFAVFTGDLPGEIKVTITAPPSFLGDGAASGDGQGVVTDYQVGIAGAPPVSRGTALPITVVSSGHLQGAQVYVVVQALGYGGRVGTPAIGSAAARVAPVTPAGPSAPTFAAGQGPNPGQVQVVISTPPAFVGDGPVANDGAGAITDYEVSIAGGGYVPHGPTLPITVVSGGHAEGVAVPVSVRARGYANRLGAAAAGSAMPRATPQVARPPTAPGLSAGPTSTAGQITVIVHTPPTFVGDGAAYADGAGVITGYVTSVGGVEVTHAPSLPLTRTVNGQPIGVPVTVQAWALGYGGRVGAPTSTTATALGIPAGPNVPTWEVLTGVNPGEIRTRITAAPSDFGDGALAGDDLGVITDYETQVAGGPWVSRGTALPIDFVSGGFTPGAVMEVSVRARGYGGRIGDVGTDMRAAGSSPRAPGAPVVTVELGPTFGSVRIRITGAPAFLGDGPVFGDTLGFVSDYQIGIAGGALTSYGTTLPHVVNSTDHAPGDVVAVVVRALGYAGRAGTPFVGSITIPVPLQSYAAQDYFAEDYA